MQTKVMSGYCRTIVLAVLISLFLCSAAAVAADCPSGCSCLLPADAKAKGYDTCNGQLSVCGYDRNQDTMYCYKTGLSLVARTLAPLSLATTTPAGTCPAGCSCMPESDAKVKFGTYSRCSETPCYSVTTGSAQLSAYCFRQGTTTTTPAPSCPQGCSCISDATAKARGGTWTRCSPDICGYEQSTATLAAVVSVPKYCMKQDTATTTTTLLPTCPEGCTCISDEDAKQKGLTDRCDNSQTPCGYRLSATTAATAAVRIPLYCYRIPVTTTTTGTVCPEGCGCMNEGDAKAKFGPFNYTRCSEKVCGYDQTATSAYSSPRYCFKGTVAVTQTTPAACPQGCFCLQEAEAKAKFGTENYTRCQADPCGYDKSATTANGIPRYCFKPTVSVSGTPAPAVCPQGCACMPDAAAKEKGLTACRGTRTSCGYDEKNQQQLFCFEQVPSPTCVYDYQKNACTGTCPQGSGCGLVASEKDASGKITYAVCGCTVPPAAACAWDGQKNACTGSCATGAGCTVIGKNTDEKTGASIPVCGCPQPSGCSYDYAKDACAGTCTVSGENCQLNTIYRDPTTGKVTYAECHCKGSGTGSCAFTADGYCTGTCAQEGQCANTTVTDASGKMTFACTCTGGSQACTFNTDGSCTGTCPQGGQCANTSVSDASGQTKFACTCGTPAGTATRPQGFLESITSFFNRLFGGK